MTRGEAIAAKGTCSSWFPFRNVGPVQGIVFAGVGAGQTIGTTIVVDKQSEGIHLMGEIYHGADGAVSCTVDHAALFS